jgi:hypothetical protein
MDLEKQNQRLKQEALMEDQGLKMVNEMQNSLHLL